MKCKWGQATTTEDNDTGSRIKSGMTGGGRFLRGYICGGSPPRDEGKECGVSPPRDAVLLFWQKDPKPWAPGRGPLGAFAPVPFAWAAELALLRQSSPPHRIRDRGAVAP